MFENILNELENIVGKDFVSNREEELYIYSQDPGASVPRSVDFIVMPKNALEVQEIIKLANKVKIPVTPMGGGLTLSGLTIPTRGGIVLDMKRMDKIIEINESSRYALIEPGVTSGQLLSYLKNHHSSLQPPVPDAPPSVTIAGNALIHGSGYVSQRHGDHGTLINGLEVVLPSGEIAKFGSAAVSNYWFARGPIPDLIGLFLSSFGTMGIVTKLSIQLFPTPKFRDFAFGLTKDPKTYLNLLPELTKTGIPEDILLGTQDKPDWMKDLFFVNTYFTSEKEEDIEIQKNEINNIYERNNTRLMDVPENLRTYYLQKPLFASSAADFRKGGGFEYVGANMPLEKVPEAFIKGTEISRKYGISTTIGSRLINQTHNILMFFTYPFNRADEKDIQNARNALHDTNTLVLNMGGIPWKAELNAQKLILNKMDIGYKKTIKAIKNLLDPNNILNPGNWVVK
ncbi:MAG: FAD-binding oxidoreductase [Promethearchaeota archaeon]